jgi:hypothetical protein
MISNIINRATDFGTLRSRTNFFSFALKIVFYILPAVIIGDYTDKFVITLKKHEMLGKNTLHYILLQTLLIISTMYFILVFLSDFISEFQVTVAGGYFIVLYFGVQTNYIDMVKSYMN